jgi:cytochrome d ubiquinol oxidase subunit I
MVAVGTLISTFWILSANSWMHTPQGHEMIDGRFFPKDWFEIIFNPSFPYRLVHMVLAAYLTTAFVVGAVGAWHLLKDRGDEAARVMFSMAMWMATIVAPIQMLAGDQHGLNTLEHQPEKIAAIEGHWETSSGIPLLLFGWPDMEREETRFAVGIPHLGSLILTHSWNGEVKGLKEWPKDQRPRSTVIFWTFRIMVGLGSLMALVGLLALYLRWRGRLYDTPHFHRACVAMAPAGFIAILCGWITTEMGRQPWLVYGLLRTADGVSPVPAHNVAASLAAFIVVYLIVFGVGVYYILKLMRAEPGIAHPPPAEGIAAAPMRPLSAGGGTIEKGGPA